MKNLPYLYLVAMCLGGAGDARAQEHEVGHWLGLGSFHVVSEKQLVRIGDVEFAFEADVTVSLNRKNRGFGFVEVSSAEDVLRLIPVWGTVDRQTGGVVLTLISVVGRQIGPEDIVVAVVQPARGDPGCLIWDFSGTEVSSRALPPPFDAEGTISLSRSGRACEPVDYGQLDAWVAIDAPLQPVEPLPPSTIVGFEAQLLLDRNQTARGFLDVYLPRSEPVRYEPIFGAAFPEDDGLIVRTVVILLLADRQGPLNTNDHVLLATVAIDARNQDDDLIWDLVNGETPVNGMFQAIGGIRVEQLNNKYPENR